MPRDQHYRFAHGKIPQAVFSNPKQFLERLHGAGGGEWLLQLWAEAGVGCEPVAATGLTAKIFQVEKMPVALIVLPEPQDPPEAWFVAVFFLEGPAFMGLIPYVYTLERGDSVDGQVRTVLCEWAAGGTHRNYGDGPPPDPAEFVHAAIQQAFTPPRPQAESLGQSGKTLELPAAQAVESLVSGVRQVPLDIENGIVGLGLLSFSARGEFAEAYRTALLLLIGRAIPAAFGDSAAAPQAAWQATCDQVRRDSPVLGARLDRYGTLPTFEALAHDLMAEFGGKRARDADRTRVLAARLEFHHDAFRQLFDTMTVT